MPKEFLKTLINNTYINGLLLNPLIIVIGWAYFSPQHPLETFQGSQCVFNEMLKVWIAVATIAWILTGLKPLLFLGEAERYLTHAVAPQVILVGVLFVTHFIGVNSLIIIGVYFTFLFYCLAIISFAHKQKVTSELTSHLTAAIKYLKRAFGNHLKFIVIGEEGCRFAYFSNYQIFRASGNLALSYHPKEFYEKLFIRSNVVRPPFIEVMNKFNLDGVVVNKSVIESLKNYPWDFEKLWLVWDSPTISVYLHPDFRQKNKYRKKEE